MAGRAYRIVLNAVPIAAVCDLLAVYAGVKAFEVHEIHLGQATATTVGNLKLSQRRLLASVTPGSGGAAVAAIPPVNPGDAAATITARAADTVQATTSGTIAVMAADDFNVVNGYFDQPAPEDRIVVPPNGAFVLSLDQAPGGAETVSGYVIVAELF